MEHVKTFKLLNISMSYEVTSVDNFWIILKSVYKYRNYPLHLQKSEHGFKWIVKTNHCKFQHCVGSERIVLLLAVFLEIETCFLIPSCYRKLKWSQIFISSCGFLQSFSNVHTYLLLLEILITILYITLSIFLRYIGISS